MVATARNEPQLRLGEERLENDALATLLAQRDAAKLAYDDAKGYLDDYLEQLDLADGEYRCGGFRLKLTTRRSTSVTIPKAKGR